MIPTKAQLTLIAGVGGNASNINSIIMGLDRFGKDAGLDKPHRLAHYIAQLAHESGSFRYDREIWGPTAAQKRYDTRTDLGNTAAADGDGKLYAGRGPLQITGKANYAAFTKWAAKYGPPDFVARPDLLSTDPWEGLSPIWFWTTRNLNPLADENNIEQLTKKINGGLNGFDDRIRFYVRTSLVLLGFQPDDVQGFQATVPGLAADGDAGPKTRAAMHMALASKSAVVAAPVTASPVVTEVSVEVKGPAGKGVADAATGAGVGAASLGGVLQTLQEQLTPFSMAGGWIGKLVVILIIAGAVMTIGGLAYRWWAMRKKATKVAELNAPTVQA